MIYYLLTVYDSKNDVNGVFLVDGDKLVKILQKLDNDFIVKGIQDLGVEVETDYTVLLKKENGLEIG